MIKFPKFIFSKPNNPAQVLMIVGFFIIGTAIAWSLVFYLASAVNDKFSAFGLKDVAKAEEKASVQAVAQRRLDGVVIKEGVDHFYPVGVMIENLPSVRPQSGLSKASVIYETLVEGASNRMLVMYDHDNIQEIGPVRSARPYYIEWLSEYEAAYAHAGGSPEAMEEISGFQIKDLNGIGREARYFWRDHSKSSPHNLYTSTEKLAFALRDKGWQDLETIFSEWRYKDDLPLEQRIEGEKFVKAKFSGASYVVEYRYDRVNNDYLRFNGGVPHLDKNSGSQIRTKNVIIEVVPKILEYGEKGRITLDVTGEGRAVISIDGITREGKWQKKDRTSRTRFFYEDGKEVEFNLGQTWIGITPEDLGVEYN